MVSGNDTIKCATKKSGSFFFNNFKSLKKLKQKIKTCVNLLFKKPPLGSLSIRLLLYNLIILIPFVFSWTFPHSPTESIIDISIFFLL